jgi:uncharacterized protein YcbK (DUF882 family)
LIPVRLSALAARAKAGGNTARTTALLIGLLVSLAPNALESAAANGDTRTLFLYHSHSKEAIIATFRTGGHYDGATLERLNWFLRDWRTDEPTKMDPRLFDALWEAYRSAGRNTGPDDPIVVVSAYRSPATNAMLRRRSSAVAEHSQHILGKAMDSTMPGLSMERLREIAMRMQRGGVGYYPNANTPFVHIDVGGVRHWPRMNYDQLVRLFPDGKTVHIPSNGHPLPGYEEARADIIAPPPRPPSRPASPGSVPPNSAATRPQRRRRPRRSKGGCSPAPKPIFRAAKPIWRRRSPRASPPPRRRNPRRSRRWPSRRPAPLPRSGQSPRPSRRRRPSPRPSVRASTTRSRPRSRPMFRRRRAVPRSWRRSSRRCRRSALPNWRNCRTSLRKGRASRCVPPRPTP